MNSLFEKNINLYAKRYPESARFIRDLETSSYDVRNSVSGHPVLWVKKSSGSEIPVDHPENPVQEATANLPAGDAKDHLMVVMGVGLGYLLFKAVENFPASRFMVIEHDPRIFKKALETFDFEKILSNQQIEFFVGFRTEYMPTQFYRFFIRDDNDEFLAALELVQNPRVVRLSLQYYQDVSRVLRQSVDNFFDLCVGNSLQDSLQGMRHALVNARHMDRMVALDPYAGFFKDTPGIVVSSGPSLNNKLKWLREVNDKAVIICADSALRKLLDNGITPFGVSCIERDDENAEYFKSITIPKNVALFAPIVIKPETFANYPGPACLVHRQCFPHLWLPPLIETSLLGMSCSHFSFQVLKILGCNPIALVGQDLAYDRASGQSHYQGVPEFVVAQYAVKEKFLVEDNQGGQIETAADWRLFRDMFGDLIRRFSPEMQVLNVIEAGSGARIPGAKRAEPEDFFSQLKMTGKAIRDFDWQAGRDKVQAKCEWYQSEFDRRLKDAIHQFRQLRHGFCDLKTAGLFDDYRKIREEKFSGLSQENRYLVEMLLRPDLKRFDSCARTLWDENEFKTMLPQMVDRWDAVLGDFLEILAA